MRDSVPYKRYQDAPTVALPANYEGSMPAMEALGRPAFHDAGEAGSHGENWKERPSGETLDLRTLGALLHYSAGVTKTKRYPGREIEFRAASCTGAMYHIELYVVAGDLPGLAAGVYHFDPEHNRLVELRQGDYRGHVSGAGGHDRRPSATGALNVPEAFIVYTDYFWRNAVKYQARAYRHTFWDAGTILANTLTMAAARQVTARVLVGFVDAEVDALLGLDGEREASVALLALGSRHEPDELASPADTSLGATPEAQPASPKESVQTEIVRAHKAGHLTDADAVAEWREAAEAVGLQTAEAESAEPRATDPDAGRNGESLESVISRRGSTRNFAPQPIPKDVFLKLLDIGSRRLPWDAGPPGDLNRSGLVHNQLYAVVNAVEGLESGAYRCAAPGTRPDLHRIRDIDRRTAAHMALGQALGANASACLYWLSDLDSVVNALGDRGYRAAQLEAGVMGGRVYLASYALGFGATGLTFYDQAVSTVFEAGDMAVMFLVAVGRSA